MDGLCFTCNHIQVSTGRLDDDVGLHRSYVKKPTNYLEESYRKAFTAEKILIAVGTKPARRPDFVFDGTHIIDR